VIRPLDNEPAPDVKGGAASVAGGATPGCDRPATWNVAELPPELEYFRSSEVYAVELSGFQGPLDLLLYLIQKDEIDIYDIPISRITEQFIKHIEVMRSISLDRAGEFLAMAATLLVIKLRMLMPKHGDDEEQPEGEDPRAELVRRLLEYKRFKEAAAGLRRCEENRHRYFARATRYPFVDQLDLVPPLRVEMFDLLSALAGVIDRVTANPVHAIEREAYTVAEKMRLIQERIEKAKTARFEELFREDAIKMEVIVTFMAILELVKRRRIVFIQTVVHGPIWIEAGERFTVPFDPEELADEAPSLDTMEAQA
jgi:segregation and condensation protein A